MSSERKLIKAAVFITTGALFGLTLWWFQPWRLFTAVEVSEALPTQGSMSATANPSESEPNPASDSPKEIFSGDLISHEHKTTGVVKILEPKDGSRVLRLEGFATSDGPDLEVWLSDAEVVEGYEGWFLADDGDHLSLGKLKGTQGDQNYEIPAGADLERFSSMSIWCVRFAVSFGAAKLVPGGQ